MEYFLYDYNKNKELEDFLRNDVINQANFLIKYIYENINNFNYYYLVCKDNEKIVGVMPFVLYINKLGNIIHSMPFIGYGGITANENNKYSIFKGFKDFLKKFSQENNVKLITICTQPFKNDEYELYKEVFKPDFERKNFYQYLHVENVFKNIKSKFRGNVRRNIKKCQRYGVQIIEDYSLEYLKNWYNKVYIKRLTQTHCAIYPFSVFETIIKHFNRDKIKMLYAILDGKIIGGGLYLNQGISIDNFMRVVDPQYLHTQAGTYLDYCSIKYSEELRVKYYNWQSCDEINSSIYKYKKDWGSKLDYHHYFTMIVGDVKELKNVPLDIIKREYKGIYVMPYEEFLK